MNFLDKGLSDLGKGAENVVSDIGHSVESGFDGAKNIIDDGINGIENLIAKTQPTPQVNSKPKPAVQPHQWTAPDVAASGQVTVHHDALTDAADVIKKYVPGLEAAVQEVAARSGAFDSLTTWATGQSFGGNLQAAVVAFQKSGTNTSQDHLDHAGKLTSASQAYSDNENTIAQSTSKINRGTADGGGSSSGTIKAAPKNAWT